MNEIVIFYLSGKEVAQESTIVQGKVLCATAIDVLLNPEKMLHEIREDFLKQTKHDNILSAS